MMKPQKPPLQELKSNVSNEICNGITTYIIKDDKNPNLFICTKKELNSVYLKEIRMVEVNKEQIIRNLTKV